jgi:hypothetical protein
MAFKYLVKHDIFNSDGTTKLICMYLFNFILIQRIVILKYFLRKHIFTNQAGYILIIVYFLSHIFSVKLIFSILMIYNNSMIAFISLQSLKSF